jgi:thiol-disulfide isomerase/thioredoxin
MKILLSSLSICLAISVVPVRGEIFKVPLTRKLKSIFHSRIEDGEITLLNNPYGLPIISMFGGNFTYDKQSLTVAVFDANENGRFNDVNDDYLVIGEADAEALYIHESLQCMKLQHRNYLRFNGRYFRFSNISAAGTSVELEIIDRADLQANATILELFTTVPDEYFELLDGTLTHFKNFVHKGKYIYVDIWGTWCPGCIQEIEPLKKIYEKHKNILTIVGLNHKDGNKDDVKKFVSITQIPWVIGFSTKDINHKIMLSGYPYGVLFDPQGNVVLSAVSSKELEGFFANSPK